MFSVINIPFVPAFFLFQTEFSLNTIILPGFGKFLTEKCFIHTSSYTSHRSFASSAVLLLLYNSHKQQKQKYNVYIRVCTWLGSLVLLGRFLLGLWRVSEAFEGEENRSLSQSWESHSQWFFMYLLVRSGCSAWVHLSSTNPPHHLHTCASVELPTYLYAVGKIYRNFQESLTLSRIKLHFSSVVTNSELQLFL
jgi:hypothetical protein